MALIMAFLLGLLTVPLYRLITVKGRVGPRKASRISAPLSAEQEKLWQDYRRFLSYDGTEQTDDGGGL